jgi:lysophospholipase L1-like esterase
MSLVRSGFLLLSSLLVIHTAQGTPSFSDFDQRARNGEHLSVVFFGGSLTWGAQATDPQLTSYRALTSRKLEETYPDAHFRFWDAAIGGTGSQLGSFRLERDVLSRKPDLVFLDFTINDNPYTELDTDRLAAYEGIVRRLVSSGIPVVQAIFAAKKDVLPNPPPRPLDAAHRAIAAAYGLPSADAVALMRERVHTGATTAEILWPMAPDVTHPGDEGYALYAEAVWTAFTGAVSEKKTVRLPDRMIYSDTYLTTKRVRISTLGELPQGWIASKPHRNASAYDFVMSRWLDDVTKAGGAEVAPLRLVVRGRNVLLFGEGTPLSGRYEVRINGGEQRIYDAGASAKGGNLRYVEIIAEGLDPAKTYTIEIQPLLLEAQELRIESICIAGESASVALIR